MTHAPENLPPASVPTPLGSIEPHSGLLVAPPEGQLLYKVMSIENCLRSITGGYLHFNRVDSYADFPGADPHDGRQLPADLPGNTGARFTKAPNFSAADYYDQARARTYACCFSLENSDYIWTSYGNGSEKGKVALVFDFNRLRARLNASLDPATARLQCGNGAMCHQIFDVNYGVVEYVDWQQHQANAEHLPNPIKYVYMKSEQFKDENELRVSLSALGIGHFVLQDGSRLEFAPSLQVPFDFRAAFSDQTVLQVLCAPDCDKAFLLAEMARLGINPAPGSDIAAP